jgi:hypothetical protein
MSNFGPFWENTKHGFLAHWNPLAMGPIAFQFRQLNQPPRFAAMDALVVVTKLPVINDFTILRSVDPFSGQHSWL